MKLFISSFFWLINDILALFLLFQCFVTNQNPIGTKKKLLMVSYFQNCGGTLRYPHLCQQLWTSWTFSQLNNAYQLFILSPILTIGFFSATTSLKLIFTTESKKILKNVQLFSRSGSLFVAVSVLSGSLFAFSWTNFKPVIFLKLSNLWASYVFAA